MLFLEDLYRIQCLLAERRDPEEAAWVKENQCIYCGQPRWYFALVNPRTGLGYAGCNWCRGVEELGLPKWQNSRVVIPARLKNFAMHYDRLLREGTGSELDVLQAAMILSQLNEYEARLAQTFLDQERLDEFRKIV
jgi:hypothetical protein